MEYRTKFEYTDEEKPPIKVKVRTILGNEAIYRIKCNEEVSILKASVNQSFDISPKHQCLVYQGKILEEGKTIKDYKIENGSVVHLIITWFEIYLYFIDYLLFSLNKLINAFFVFIRKTN